MVSNRDFNLKLEASEVVLKFPRLLPKNPSYERDMADYLIIHEQYPQSQTGHSSAHLDPRAYVVQHLPITASSPYFRNAAKHDIVRRAVHPQP